MTNYKKGRAFEYRVKHFLERAGFVCLRTAGSHGFCDLIAIKPDTVQFIQCKTKRPSKHELHELKKLIR
jgi:Holliday junction resolvase